AGIGLVGYRSWARDPQQQALHSLRKAGATTKQLYEGTYAVSLGGTQQLDLSTKLKLLKHIPRLTWLDLHGTGIADHHLSELAGLAGLVTLDLGANPGITDAGLPRLHGLSKLRDLCLEDAGITQDGLRSIAQLQDLRLLDLSGVRITGAQL